MAEAFEQRWDAVDASFEGVCLGQQFIELGGDAGLFGERGQRYTDFLQCLLGDITHRQLIARCQTFNLLSAIFCAQASQEPGFALIGKNES